ncbi:Uncharacterized protein APZ42_024473 [Daphnia magna]|uniref:Uncharacterized protein n=1 Tax=Daphnia magna TaxID=35525 RepID=A0A164U0X8_9CRUS|nr:Uncharacterized protein APZ42_024473 [Daphnia magna]
MDGCCLSNRARRFVLCLSPFIRNVCLPSVINRIDFGPGALAKPGRTTTDSFVPLSCTGYSSAFIT